MENQTPLTIQRLMKFSDRHDPQNEYIEIATRKKFITIYYYHGLDDPDFEEEDFKVWVELNQFGSDVSIHFPTVEKLKAFISLYE